MKITHDVLMIFDERCLSLEIETKDIVRQGVNCEKFETIILLIYYYYYLLIYPSQSVTKKFAFL